MNHKKELSAFFNFDGNNVPTLKSQGDTIGEQKGWEDAWLKVREANLLAGGSTLTSPYSQNAWVYRAISLIASNIPQAPFRIYRGKELLSPTEPIVQLFENPNTLQSSFEFWEAIASYLNLYGEAMVFMNESVGQQIGTRDIPAELIPLNPSKVRHAVVDGVLAGWEYNSMPIEVDELIHFKLFNPRSELRGQSPLEAAKFELEADYSASKWNNVFFKNNATPDGVVSVDKDKQIDIKELRKLKKMWYQNHGTTDNSHKTAFLLGGMTYSHMGITQKDMDFIAGRKFSRESILSVFGVNTFVAGYYTDATITRATALASMRVFWENTLIPQVLRIEQKFHSKFFMRFFNDGTFGKFDLSVIPSLQEDYNESVKTAKELFSIGFTRNEVNQRLHLGFPDDDKDGDIRYLPINLVAVGEDEGGVPEVDPSKSMTGKANKDTTEKANINKNKYQNRYLKIQSAMEKKLESKMKRYFFELRKSVLGILNDKKAFTTAEEAEVMAEINALFSGDEIKVLVEPIYRESLEQAGNLALDNIGVKRPFVISEAILEKRLNLIKGINDTLFKEVRSAVFDGIKEGANIPTISDSVKGVFNISTNRAKIIARTETASLMSAQTQVVYKEEGIMQKQWITTVDDATRDSHLAQNGQVVGINETFDNGLMFPGDPNGSAEEVINCRCALAPVVQ